MKVLYLFSNLTSPPSEGIHAQTFKTLEIISYLGHDLLVAGFSKSDDFLAFQDFTNKHGPKISEHVLKYKGSILKNSLVMKFRRGDPFGIYLKDSPMHHANFDIIICEGLLSASVLRRRVKHKSIVNLVDSTSLRQYRLFKISRCRIWHLFASLLGGCIEYSLRKLASMIIVVSKSDKAHLAKVITANQIITIPIVSNSISGQRLDKREDDQKVNVLIWMDLSVEHLVQSFIRLATWLNQNRVFRNDFRFHVLCKDASNSVLEQFKSGELFSFVEWAIDLDAYIGGFDIALLPDLTGTGLKNRLLDCIRNNVPVIATDAVLEGFEFVPEIDVLMYSNFQELQDLLQRVGQDPNLGKQLSVSALETLKANYSLEKVQQEWSFALGYFNR